MVEKQPAVSCHVLTMWKIAIVSGIYIVLIYLPACNLLLRSSWIRRIWLERWQWVSFRIHTTSEIEQNSFGTTGLHEGRFTLSLHKIYIIKSIKRTALFLHTSITEINVRSLIPCSYWFSMLAGRSASRWWWLVTALLPIGFFTLSFVQYF